MHNIAVIPGDGIGREVISEAQKVLEVALPNHTATEFDLGARCYARTGEALPASVQAELADHDAILLGAVGDPSVGPGILERGLLLKLRFDFDQYVNLRPARLWPGVNSPLAEVKSGEIDFLVVREGTEGLYAGAGGVVQRGTSAEVATEESLNTRYGVERVVRHACQLAALRERKRLTLVHKTNVLVNAGSLWQRTFDEVVRDFPELTTDYQHVDAASMFMVDRPETYDVIVTDNLFGDILTDIAAAITGGIGLAASGCINPDQSYPSMFEPVHGSAPDIAGQGIADPIAAIISAAMLLDHLGRAEDADIVRRACAAELADRKPGQPVRTAEVGDRVAAAVEKRM
ncbi:3-isopropylmalate dehydrogenase [Natronoglycomyces albus]|uniref:3-isopropylmalate dehydrogenase n=1 Tax=Natronoglycomyces albus TaxID=2811108 RepID=A0A895XJB6_9ACTN|nr:3-isopropylmalate dehydrogenase [Natronoglycomyces albus]QSB03902.1 3-isopropylmalate dehydrogenase [Natronoglycomyces albus]